MVSGRWIIPAFAVLAVVGAMLFDPGHGWEAACLAVAGAALVVASLRSHLLAPAAPVVVVGSALAQTGGHLEVGLFLLSLLAMAMVLDRPLTPGWALAVAVICATPIGYNQLVPAANYSPGIWTLGVALPAAIGWAVAREARLSHELAGTRVALAEQRAFEERRRIARDVHDLVGHGLAAMLVQVASARHVLHRDPAGADEALATAEDVGRRGLRELRSTITHLREGEEPPTALPTLADVERLVVEARARGLPATLSAQLPDGAVDAMSALTAYRILQEALTNAERHAPMSPTEVALVRAGEDLVLRVLSRAVTTAPDGRGFGLLGMRERAEAVGGRLSAGPTVEGWLVEAVLPADAG